MATATSTWLRILNWKDGSRNNADASETESYRHSEKHDSMLWDSIGTLPMGGAKSEYRRSPLSKSLSTTQMSRRFPAPWTGEKIPGGFKVLDANGQSLAYVYSGETTDAATIA